MGSSPIIFSLRQPPVDKTAPHVFGMGYGFKVIGVHAATVAAKMIQFKAIANLANPLFIHPAMRVQMFPRFVFHAVARGRPSALPLPARRAEPPVNLKVQHEGLSQTMPVNEPPRELGVLVDARLLPAPTLADARRVHVLMNDPLGSVVANDKPDGMALDRVGFPVRLDRNRRGLAAAALTKPRWVGRENGIVSLRHFVASLQAMRCAVARSVSSTAGLFAAPIIPNGFEWERPAGRRIYV